MKSKLYKNLLVFNAFLLICIFVLGCFMQNQAKAPENVFKRCMGCVVEVKAETEEIGESFGTAVLLSDDGRFVTNAHVVSFSEYGEQIEFETVQVRFADKENYEKCLIEKIDYDLDLAILKLVEGRKLNPIKSAKKDCKYGERVFAIGNTSNYGLGISEGIISVPRVNVVYEEITKNVIQADIAVSAGNSGGALLNEKGELLGIITFRTKDNSGKINYGFVYAIPVEEVQAFFNEG